MDIPSQAPILLVDDNPAKLLALKSILTDPGLHLITAPSARAALLVLLHQEVAVILLDVNMPEMDGFELAELIRSHPRCAQTPLIFLSAVNTTEAYTFKGYSLGAVDYLAELNPVVIRAKVSVFVDLFQKTRALRLLNAELEQRVQERTAALAHLNAVLQEEIAERQKTELALRHAKDELTAILQSVAEGVTVQAPDGCLVYANEAAAQLIGYPSAAALLQASVPEIMQGFVVLDEAGAPFPLLQLPGRRALHGELRPEAILRFRVQSTQEERWSQVHATPIFDDHGVVRLAVNVFRDVTVLKQAEEGQRFLAEAGALLASSLDQETTFRKMARLAVPRLADWCTVSRLDDQGKVETVAVAHVDPIKETQAWEFRRRYPPPTDAPYGESQVLRTGRPELYPEIPEALLAGAAGGDAAWLQMLRTVGFASAMSVPVVARGQVLAVMTFVATESGRRYGEADRALAEEVAQRAAMAIENARLYRDALAARDMLARQADELRRSNTELQQFAYVASHDLQEPLRMVTTYVRFLAKRYQGVLDAEAEEFIGYAVEGAQRMKALIDDVLAYSRVGTRKKPFAPVACEQVLAAILQTLQVAIVESQARISHEPLPVIYGDELQIGLLFQNLLSNAVKFRDSRPPQIHISARREGRQWRFAIQDNGIGVDPAHAEQIFVLFQRLHTRDTYPGTGMGLAICKKIVEQHGGRIWVESVGGAGATFFFTLPASEPESP